MAEEVADEVAEERTEEKEGGSSTHEDEGVVERLNVGAGRLDGPEARQDRDGPEERVGVLRGEGQSPHGGIDAPAACPLHAIPHVLTRRRGRYEPVEARGPVPEQHDDREELREAQKGPASMSIARGGASERQHPHASNP